MRSSDWSSDVCSSDLPDLSQRGDLRFEKGAARLNLRRDRPVLRRQAFDAVDDDRAGEAQPVVDPAVVAVVATPEASEHRAHPVPVINTCDRPPGRLIPLLSRITPPPGNTGCGVNGRQDPGGPTLS